MLRIAAASCALGSLFSIAHAQEIGELPAFEGEVMDGGMPVSEMGGGDFFSQELGTLLRIRYNTESYGQDQHGNLDLGTMQVASFQDAITFVDAQVTLNDISGVGFNAGVGFRWLHWMPFPLEPERITGLSLWADGTSTESGNFFPQVGLSYESLGDMWDFRLNSYIPVGQESQLGPFSATGNITFDSNFLVLESVADRNTSFNVAEFEVARRLIGDRDAWAFVGPYVLANNEDDATGYRVGMRGYAYPDLLLQVAVTDDDIFKTNAAFSITWFVGRTRTNFQPACGLPDRMREPVMRNDYVALAKSTVTGGEALTDNAGTAFRFVHVDSAAPDGGDGTFENPLNDVGEVEGNSQESDIVLLYSDSQFVNQNTLVLQDNQRLLGEGNNEIFTVNTLQEGVVDIPETSPGSRAGDRPIILGSSGLTGAVQLADTNEVANFDIDGTGSGANVAGIFSPALGAGNPNIHDMEIRNTTGDGIQFTPLIRDNDDNDATPQVTVAGNVTIDDLVFINVGANDVDINSATTADITSPNVTLQEVIALTDITSSDGDDFSLNLSNTHAGTGRSTTIARYTYNGGIGNAGGILLTNFNGTLNASNSTLRNGLQAGLQIAGASDGNITFANTVTFESVDGTVINIGPNPGDNFTGTLSVLGDVTENDTGQLVSIQRTSGDASITIAGDLTDVADAGSQGIFIGNNTDGTILFTGAIDVDTTNVRGVQLLSNADTDIRFDGELDIFTDGANGFDADNGDNTSGSLIVSNTANSIDVENGVGLRILNSNIGTQGVNFGDVNVATSPTNGILLQNNAGAAVTVGATTDTVGLAGTISGTLQDAVVIDNSANVSITGLRINAEPNTSGVRVEKDTAGTQVTDLSDLEINDGDFGIEVVGNGTGTLNMTVNDSAINDSTAFGLSFDNIDTGLIRVNNTTIDGNNAAAGAVGVRILNSNATFVFDDDPVNDNTLIQEFSGTDFLVQGGTPTVTFAGRIVNATTNPGDTTGRSVDINGITGGSVTFSGVSEIIDDNGGMIVQNNTGGSVSVQGINNFDTETVDALTVISNTGGTFAFNNFDITTTTGRGVNIETNDSDVTVNFNGLDIVSTTGAGFRAIGPATVSVSGAGNTITTTTGTGVDIRDLAVGASGVNFQTVNVNGATNGIILEDLTGGQVAIGSATGAADSGGSLTTTGNAIMVTNVANVDLNNIRIVSAGGIGANIVHTASDNNMDVTIDGLNLDASGGVGVDVSGADNGNTFNMRLRDSDLEERVAMSITGSSAFVLLVENNLIDTTGTDDAFTLAFSGSAQNGDVTIRNGNDFTAVDGSALVLTTAGGNGKTVDLLIDGTGQQNVFTNASADPAANFLVQGTSTLNANIQTNTFDNAGAGTDFLMTANSSALSRIRLNLGGDDASDFNTALGGGFDLVQADSADFDLTEMVDTFADLRNNGLVDGVGTFGDLMTVTPPLPVLPP